MRENSQVPTDKQGPDGEGRGGKSHGLKVGDGEKDGDAHGVETGSAYRERSGKELDMAGSGAVILWCLPLRQFFFLGI